MSVSKFLGTYFISRNYIQDEDDDGGIPLDDWKQIIDKDPSLEPIGTINGDNPITGEGYKFPIKGGAKWKNNPEKNNIPFSWSHGKIVCQAITEASFGKIKELADQLNALCLKDDFD